MPFCTACGRQNPDDARFCSQCGTRLVTPDAPAEPSRGETTATISIGAGDSRVETSDRQLNPVDAAAVDAARARWKAYTAAGHALTYWRQTESGGWEKKKDA